MSGWLESVRDRLLCRLGYHQWRHVGTEDGVERALAHYECRNCGEMKSEWK